MATIHAAVDVTDLRALKGLRYEKLKGKRSHERSMRLNDQWRLTVEEVTDSDGMYLRINAIEDYHS